MPNVFAVTFNAVAVTAAQDVFELVAPSDAQLAVREVRLGQYSDAGDTAAEILSVLIVRGYTTSGSGGTAPTPRNITNPASGALASTATAEVNNTTVAQDGTAITLMASAWNVQTEYLYKPDKEERPIVPASGRLVVRITAPADSLTMNGTLLFEEIGQGPA